VTSAELAGGVFHVFRLEEDLATAPSLAQEDRRSGRAFFGRVVEVARTANGAPPPGIATATASAATGTISFPIARLGRYQAFLEAATGTATIFRETFDSIGQDSAGLAALPQGWSGAADWLVGKASAGRPAAASAPNLLAVGLRRDYRKNANDAVTSTAFPISSAATLGRTAKLRLTEAHAISTTAVPAERVEVTLVARAGALTARQTVATFQGTSGGYPALVAVTPIDVTAAITTLLGAGGVNAAEAQCTIELRLFSDVIAGPAETGFFVDDLELTFE
jgi:hypothetical protein